MAATPINRLTIIGVGLIGGSLARAARRAGVVKEIVGAGRNPAELQKAVDLGVIDRFETDLAAAVAGADMVMLAVPVGAMEPVFRQIADHLEPGTVLTDVGSVKGSVVEAARRAFGELPRGLVPGHPIAGTEKSGVEASFAELYQGRCVILTPLPDTDPRATAKVRNLWEGAGAEVVEMDVQHHDEVLAATSHLPHMLAFALVDTLASLDERSEIFRYAAGGFRDFTRIASSDPVMWRDICVANRDALVAMLERFQYDLRGLTEAIQAGRADQVEMIFTRAKKARDNFTGLMDKTARQNG